MSLRMIAYLKAGLHEIILPQEYYQTTVPQGQPRYPRPSLSSFPPAGDRQHTHLLRFALARELGPAGRLTVDAIVADAGQDDFKLRNLIKRVALSDAFLQSR